MMFEKRIRRFACVVWALAVLFWLAGCNSTTGGDDISELEGPAAPKAVVTDSAAMGDPAEEAGNTVVANGKKRAGVTSVDTSAGCPHKATGGCGNCPHREDHGGCNCGEKDGTDCSTCPHRGTDDSCNCPHKGTGGGGNCLQKKEGGCGHQKKVGCPHHRDNMFTP